jgi:hypothetical protein
MAGKQQRTGARKQRATAEQRRARADMARLSAAWSELTDEQLRAWNVRAQQDRRGGRRARLRRRSGHRLFVKVNFRRLALGQEPLSWPPGSDSYRPMPMGRLVITNTGGRTALQVYLAGGAAEGVMVSSWSPLSRGIMVWRKFVRIGLLPAPVGGISDITRQYVAKYGVPAVGKKVFIRLQQLNDYTGNIVQVMAAVVPAARGGQGRA